MLVKWNSIRCSDDEMGNPTNSLSAYSRTSSLLSSCQRQCGELSLFFKQINDISEDENIQCKLLVTCLPLLACRDTTSKIFTAQEQNRVRPHSKPL